MRVALNITGGSFPSRAVQLSSQSTKNFYPEVQDSDATLSPYVLQPWPGLALFGTAGSAGVDRGMLAHKGVLYKVSGTTLYTVDSGGTHTSRGTIAGSTQCTLVGIDDNIIIANGTDTRYQWNGTTLSTISDADLENGESVTHLNRTAIYDGDDDKFFVSAVGDATDINALDVARAESHADDLVNVYAFQQKLYLMGEKTIEPWFFSGVDRPPVAAITGAVIPVGLASRMSAANNDQFLYFLGDDRRVYRISEGYQNVSDVALSSTFESYATVNDAKAFCLTLEGQNFYHLAFPTEDKTWVYSEPANEWFELNRSSSTGRGLANSYAFIYGKHLVADYRNENIYELDVDTYKENGLQMTRERTTGPLHAGLLGFPGYDIELERFELIVERGQGDVTTTDPKIMLQISTNGGRTFGTEMWKSIGKSGEFARPIVWTGLGKAEQFVFKIKTSDPVKFSIHSAAAEIEIAH